MKKKIYMVVSVIAAVLMVVFAVQSLLVGWIFPNQIKRVEFRGFDSCEKPAENKVELSRSEIWTFALNYNLAAYAGIVDAEGCPSDFGFVIYLTDGRHISIREAGAPRIEVSTFWGKHWIKSNGLTEFAQKLMDKYHLSDS